MTTQQDEVEVTVLESGILHICLNRKEQLNALNQSVLQRLMSLFAAAKEDQNVKAILLTGAGKAFCAGADINELAAIQSATAGLSFSQFGQATLNCLESLGKPSLAAIHGFALGGGCELAMAATLRIAATNSFFGQPEIKLGIIPGFGGTQRLSRLIGKGRALELCLTGNRLTAESALQFGLINEITSAENLLPRAITLLTELIKHSSLAMQSLLTVIHQGYDLPLSESLALEAAYFGVCSTSADKKEGVSAFMEKRPPVFGKT